MLDGTSNYTFYFIWLIELVILALFIVGSICVFKSRRTANSWTLLISSSLAFVTTLLEFSIEHRILSLYEFYDPDLETKHLDELLHLQTYSWFLSLLAILAAVIFALAFIYLCSSFASTLNRAKQLEHINKELLDQD
ncbi:MAG: hypothetical protein ACSHX6_13530 [Akkermansiaceae bacterium]